jgi:hypothetical protein
VRATIDDPDAGTALAEAYATLGPEDRAKLLDAVCEDAVDSESAIAALLAMLTVEPDVGLARQIAARLRPRCDLGEDEAREPLLDAIAALHREGDAGEAVLLLPTDDGHVDALLVRWVDDASSELTVRLGIDAEQAHEGLPEAPLGDVVRELAPVLLAHRRRGGSWPEDVARFAPLFDHG